jgi:hypothetical protein
MRKWEKLTNYLQQKKVPKGGTLTISFDDLRKIVGWLAPKTIRRISYWDPYMGKQNLTPGSAAWKAGFALAAINWKSIGDELHIISIALCRFR